MPSWLLFKTPARREPSASPAGEPAPKQKTAGPATLRRRSRYFYALLQQHRHGRALAGVAFQAEFPAQQLHRVLDDGQAQPRAACAMERLLSTR